jgi:hypothetical protein
MDLYRIKNQMDCLEKVRRVFHVIEGKKKADED